MCIRDRTCIGPASKEMSRHYWREPLVLEALYDKEIDLCGAVSYTHLDVYKRQTYLCDGENILGMHVGDGWYHGFMTKAEDDTYDPAFAILLQLEVTYTDGTTGCFGTDETVKVKEGPEMCIRDRTGDHVITTVLEHNSVLRPLYECQEKGVELTILGCDKKGNISLQELEDSIHKETKAIPLKSPKAMIFFFFHPLPIMFGGRDMGMYFIIRNRRLYFRISGVR